MTKKLIIVDLFGPPRQQRVVRAATRFALWKRALRSRFVSGGRAANAAGGTSGVLESEALRGQSEAGAPDRAAGATDSGGLAADPRVILLVASPGGSVSEDDWPRGVEVLTPIQVLPSHEIEELQEATHSALEKLVNGEGKELFPRVHGVSLGDMSRLILIPHIRYSLLITRAADLLCASRGVEEIHVYSDRTGLGESIRAAVKGRCEVHSWLAYTIRRLTDLRKGWGGRASPADASYSSGIDARASVADGGERSSSPDLLIVTESTPMARMFMSMERELMDAGMSRVACLQYGLGGSGGGDAGLLRPIPLDRPDLAEPRARGRYLRRLRGFSDALHSFRVEQEFAGVRYEVYPSEIIAAVHRDMFDAQTEHLHAVNDLLEVCEPRLVVVGNDRWWIGQAFVQLARQRAIPTVAIQDGVTAAVAEWFWTCADTIIASSDLLVRILAAHGTPPERIVVAGQPRYDAASSRAAELKARARAVPGHAARSEAGRTVLLATQTMQDFSFVQRCLGGILAVPGTHVILRPHPSEDSSRHRALAARDPRVSFDPSTEVFELLARSSVVVCQGSTVVLEAAMLGIPAVTVNFTGLPDVVPYAEYGLAYGVSDPKELAGTLERIIELPAAERDHASGKRAAALELMLGPTDGQSARRTVDCLRTILGGSGGWVVSGERAPGRMHSGPGDVGGGR